MGVFVFLPLFLPLTAWPVARLAGHRLHPRTATRLLTAVAVVMALCSTLCLALLMVVGTAQLPGNPLPDGWSDPEVRAAVPYDALVGQAAIPALAAVAIACGRTLRRHLRRTRDAHRALDDLPGSPVAVLRDGRPYAYALPPAGTNGGRVVVTTGLLGQLASPERRALFAHERAHLAGRHDRYLLAVRLAARANPFLLSLRTAVEYGAERWADECAAQTVGDRALVARAIGKAALALSTARSAGLPGFAGITGGLGGSAGQGAGPGPVPRRVAALLGPAPAAHAWPPSVFTAAGLAAWAAAGGTVLSAMSSANSAVTMVLLLHAATPL
ncbi:Protease HtpX [Streptomyces sp. YIM 130001]|uniref:M56 family metallopeptidase n=1 Tax=Streptomyces sp. YIM 130001 TaxID=2259644 RepID=UPI000E6534B8|nr:M56 family metallopeptidase [Streptomyces sp. YIM 130001]RII09191.1 Protease HtpX [Streptomyces sp. YIM 130001]